MGGGKRGSAPPPPPPPPAPPPAPPTQVDARRAIAQRGGAPGGRSQAANVRNRGGGRGIEIAGNVARALKSLTGQ